MLEKTSKKLIRLKKISSPAFEVDAIADSFEKLEKLFKEVISTESLNWMSCDDIFIWDRRVKEFDP